MADSTVLTDRIHTLRRTYARLVAHAPVDIESTSSDPMTALLELYDSYCAFRRAGRNSRLPRDLIPALNRALASVGAEPI